MSDQDDVPSETEDVKTDSNNENAETERAEESESLESYLAENGLYNTDLLKVLKDENVSTKEDLRTKFKNPGDVTNICNAMRKRIETVVRNFCKNISSLTGIKNEYQEPVFPIAMKSPRALPEKQTSNTKKNENNNNKDNKNKDKDKDENNKKKAVRPKHTHAKTKAVTTTTTKNKKKSSTKSSGKETPKKNSESLKSPKKNKTRSKSRGSSGTSPKKSNKNQADSIINAAAARKGSSVVGDYKKQNSRKNVSKTKDETKVEDIEASAKKGAELKSWLQKNSCFHKELFAYLVAHEYYSHEDLVSLTQKQFDKIVRQVRVSAFEEVNEAAKRKRIDKLLVKFEKEWRKSCGVNKTSQPAPKDLPASFWG